MIIGAVVDWASFGPSANSFKVAAGSLFDSANTDPNPKLSFTFWSRLRSLAFCFRSSTETGWLRFVCGALATAAAILYFVQVGDALSSSSELLT